jgi:EmrB/QacA subfamily drug resistance transporter
MVSLDVTIMNVALPSAQRALHFSIDSRQWAITAYALAFGSLLLLGGKFGDLFGRKWTFIVGLIGFAGASAIGGLAQSYGALVGARVLQGVFAALLAPSALSLLTLAFHDSPDRPKALGIFSALAAAGASSGLLLGGVVTQLLSWRWCMYVNLVIAVPIVLLALRLIYNVRPQTRPRIDLPGALLSSAGLFALVYGFAEAETHSWSSSATIMTLAAGIALLTAFVVLEDHIRDPLVPLYIVWNRARGGSYAAMILLGSGVFAQYLFLSFYMQGDMGFTPVEAGIGFLPFTGTVAFVAVAAQSKVLPRIGPKRLVMAGSAFAAIGQVLLTRLSPHASYVSEVLPGLVLTGAGVGSIYSAAIANGTFGVGPGETGIAAALVNASLQIGGSIGTAVLSTIFASAAFSYAASHPHAGGAVGAATLHGYMISFWSSAGIFALGLLVAALTLPRRAVSRPSTGGAPSTCTVAIHPDGA